MSPARASTRTRLAVGAGLIAIAGFGGGYVLAGGGGDEVQAAATPARFAPDGARPLIRVPASSSMLPALARARRPKVAGRPTGATGGNPPLDNKLPAGGNPPVGSNPPPPPPPPATHNNPPAGTNLDPQE